MQKNTRRKRIIIILSCLIIALGVGILLFTHVNKPKKAQIQQNPLLAVKDEVSFPLYYPKVLPSSLNFKNDSLSVQSGVVNFSYTHGAKNLVVTEQSRPPVMEQVQQIQTVQTPVGRAYIADLNGNITGFVVTDKTLVIISNAAESDSSLLSDLMASMQQI